MLDFLIITHKKKSNGMVEVFPKFVINNNSTDLMVRGGDFYAIWVEERGLWSTNEQDVIKLVDDATTEYHEKNKHKWSDSHVLYMWDADSGIIDKWHKYCKQQSRDNFNMLDEKLIFSNSGVNKNDFASKRLLYPLEKGDISAWDKLIGTLYDEDARLKIEWAIGAIITGDAKEIQKFMVLYGSAGTGKSTILNIIQMLFDGYYSVFDAKALGNANSSFALESFRTNPLVAIQHDGDLSRIEDNTRLNSLVSHEFMTVNEKFKSSYSNRFKCFLFMGTNKPVKITDAKSGLIRRLIDVSPSGNKLSAKEYRSTMNKVKFELGAIAYHCKEVYEANKDLYDDYVPISMMGATNDFYNYILDMYFDFSKEDGVTLKTAWERYKTYCEDTKAYQMPQRAFKEELKNYFDIFEERSVGADGVTRVRNYYSGFKKHKFEESSDEVKTEKKQETDISWIDLKEQDSIFDKLCASCPAQYANSKEVPNKKWTNVRMTLGALDTKRIHYVKVPENHIVIDFDIADEDGNKSLELNLREANKWPATYVETSKGGQGLHLHYIYNGDVNKLSRIFSDHIEIKVFTGGSSLRRKLTKCNDLEIATISSGLPLKKGETKVVNFDSVKSEQGLRSLIERNLRKEIHPGTKPSIDFIYKILEDAYESGLKYDVSDTRNSILAFAAGSTHQSEYCMKLVGKMKFKSEEQHVGEINNSLGIERDIIFYDVEVFPNLFLVNWKLQGKDKPVVRMINPTPADIEELLQYRLIGFNCRRYDNHIMYGRWMGYDNEALYNLSQRIVNNDRTAFFSNAYDLSYTDVYDFASAANKMSLKKWEIKLGIHHHELGLPWDQPVAEELWPKVAEYCDDDVIATEAVFEHLSADWTARQILADLAGMNYNSSTNSLTTKIIFGDNRTPQNEFHYRNLAEPVHDLDEETYSFLYEACPGMMSQTHGEAGSLLPYFPGYEYNRGKSTYRGEEVGEGGYVYAEPGMYGNVALLDIASMHPHSTIAECLFGVRYTRAYRDIVEGRVSIKHEAWAEVNNMLEGKLTPYIQKVINGEMTSGDLANALKTAINSVYGLTSASFENPFKHPKNVDNIVAKRGALFMVDLKHAVQEQGFTVAHIKTDSIKIPDATPEIIQFVMDFGLKYGYTFEHEATYDRMCLVNDAVYIAKYKDGKHAGEWTATGKQFAVPYLFKKLFSKEDILFEDLCETFQVQTSLYLDMNEEMSDVSMYEDLKEYRRKNRDGINITKKAQSIVDEYSYLSDEDLDKEIAKGHNYQFIGKVGSFCPMKTGAGGGWLLREGKDKDQNTKYYSATGSKGYRWMDSEMVKELNKEDMIDRSYYEELVDDAVSSLIAYGNYEWFISDDPYIPPKFENGRPVYSETIALN